MTLRRFLPAVLVAIVLAGFGCKAADPAAIEGTKPLTLKYWRVFDDGGAYDAAITAYQQLHPNITIEQRRLRFDEYEREILAALAEDRGPDIISMHNTWIGRWQDRLLPAPAGLTVVFREVQGGLQKEVVPVIRTIPGPTPATVANDFVDVVAQDVIMPVPQADPRAPEVQGVYALPLSVDTLALYYNRDLLDRAGIPEPASDWPTFQKQMEQLTRLDETGAIIQSGAALGTADNIERPSDILAALMIQNGTAMTDAAGMATFDKYTQETAGRPLPPGAEALVFYADFANPEKKVYSWNDKMPAAIDAFVSGQTAYFFGYAYHLPTIRRLNPALNLGIATFPQVAPDVRPVHFANYWVEGVLNKTKHPNEAWEFVQFMTKAENAAKYLAATKKPTALRSLVNTQLEDLDLSVFAAQAPSARSWYHGTDASAVESAFEDMIRQMRAAQLDPKRIVELGAAKVNQTIQ